MPLLEIVRRPRRGFRVGEGDGRRVSSETRRCLERCLLLRPRAAMRRGRRRGFLLRRVLA